MKKIKILLFLCLFFLPYKVNASEVDYKIDAFKIDAYIKENGSVEVFEYIKQTGTFNGYVRELVYAGDNTLYNASSISNIKVYDLNVNSMSKGKEFSLVNYGTKGKRGIYELRTTSNGLDITMYNATNKGSSGYVINYTLNDVVVVHNDVAEFAWNFIGEGFLDILHNVDIKVYLPGVDENLRVWAHGPLMGSIYPTHEKLSYANATIEFINPKTPVDVRMTFNKELVSSSTKLTNKDALEDIIKDEILKAEEANLERQKAKTKMFVEIAFAVSYFIGVAITLFIAYRKYDKEYNVDFNHEYYRDIPGIYGPEILEYLLKKDVTTSGYSASILEIIRKKAIIVSDNPNNKKDYYLTKSKEKIIEPLTNEENKICDFLINEIGNGQMVSLKEIKNYGKKEQTAKKMLKNFNNWKSSTIKCGKDYNFYENNYAVVPILVILLLTIVCSLATIDLFPAVIIVIIFTGIVSIAYLVSIKKRTKEGALEYEKWQAFKRFLKDFGRFNEKELPEVVLWEKYLVYASVLGVAKQLQNDMKIKINAIENSNTNIDFMDIYMMNYIINANINATISDTVSNAISISNTTIATSTKSSGSGFGGGFAGGGGFGGGGGGGHGF